LIYGIQEPVFLKNDADFIKIVYQDSNSFAEIRSFDGGHDYKIWNQELVNLLTKLFSTNK
jgi:enterochelin esterase-like enzyme